jgi:hypothetical protein
MISENGVVIPTQHVQATICALARQFEASETENGNLRASVRMLQTVCQEKADMVRELEKALAIACTSLQEAGAEVGSLRSWKAAGEEAIDQLKLAMIELRDLLEKAGAHEECSVDLERMLKAAAARIGEAIG